MKSLVKDNAVSVLLSDEDARLLARAVEIEVKRRGDARLGKATLLREAAMPVIRAIVKKADAALQPTGT